MSNSELPLNRLMENEKHQAFDQIADDITRAAYAFDNVLYKDFSTHAELLHTVSRMEDMAELLRNPDIQKLLYDYIQEHNIIL